MFSHFTLHITRRSNQPTDCGNFQCGEWGFRAKGAGLCSRLLTTLWLDRSFSRGSSRACVPAVGETRSGNRMPCPQRNCTHIALLKTGIDTFISRPWPAACCTDEHTHGGSGEVFEHARGGSGFRVPRRRKSLTLCRLSSGRWREKPYR